MGDERLDDPIQIKYHKTLSDQLGLDEVEIWRGLLNPQT